MDQEESNRMTGYRGPAIESPSVASAGARVTFNSYDEMMERTAGLPDARVALNEVLCACAACTSARSKRYADEGRMRNYFMRSLADQMAISTPTYTISADAARELNIHGTALVDGDRLIPAETWRLPPAKPYTRIEDQKKQAAEAERTRILALLDAMKPPEQPYTRRDWAIEQKGEMRMWEKLRKAIEGGA